MFFSPRIFHTQWRKVRSRFDRQYEDISITTDPCLIIEYQDVIRNWNEQVALWSSSRPWYDPAHKTWEKVRRYRLFWILKSFTGMGRSVSKARYLINKYRHRGAIFICALILRGSLYHTKKETKLNARPWQTYLSTLSQIWYYGICPVRSKVTVFSCPRPKGIRLRDR